MSIAVRWVSPWTAAHHSSAGRRLRSIARATARSDSRTCLFRGSRLAPQGSRGGHGWRSTAPPGRPSCPHRRDGRPIRDGAGLAARGPVIDALADQSLEAVDRQATPGDPGGDNDSARAQHVAAVERNFARRRVDAGDRARDQDLCAEPPRLMQRAGGKFVTGNPAGKAEIVLDPRGGARLAAGRLALDDDRAQPLGCAVDRSRQAGRPAADDCVS